MKNLGFLLITLLITSLSFLNCSKSPSSAMLGKWRADSVSGMPKNVQTEIFYEFTKEKIIATGSVHGTPLDKMEMPYTIKSEEGKTLILSVTHPSSGAQGDFKIRIDGKQMTMQDPDGKPFLFTKVE